MVRVRDSAGARPGPDQSSPRKGAPAPAPAAPPSIPPSEASEGKRSGGASAGKAAATADTGQPRDTVVAREPSPSGSPRPASPFSNGHDSPRNPGPASALKLSPSPSASAGNPLSAGGPPAAAGAPAASGPAAMTRVSSAPLSRNSSGGVLRVLQALLGRTSTNANGAGSCVPSGTQQAQLLGTGTGTTAGSPPPPPVEVPSAPTSKRYSNGGSPSGNGVAAASASAPRRAGTAGEAQQAPGTPGARPSLSEIARELDRLEAVLRKGGSSKHLTGALAVAPSSGSASRDPREPKAGAARKPPTPDARVGA
ncbi:hypothetical protein HYH03_004326 [Edaphochlamys debaryana]|uniref:Uncharacterized protein n=1 Tax=Edaphochlamys debaryana TaxID=47281 RepID=A0A835Y7A7_9CHLO|nr:hypothetical protein HYH03_004326 [Edaphochlamys debaryana]|eukprot:KAG2497580.1 hypothetical protein HYH03_004326 [Edaphochlamys debaryana]